MKKRNKVFPQVKKRKKICIGEHKGPFKFTKTKLGTRRTCKHCGQSITEVGRHMSAPISPMAGRSNKKKKDDDIPESINNSDRVEE